MIESLQRVLVVSIIMALVGVLLHIAKSQKTDVTDTVIRSPKMYFWIACAGILVFGTFIAVMAITPANAEWLVRSDSDWWVYLMCSLFILLGLYLIISYLNWQIVLNENDFIYRTMWKKSYRIKYSEVTHIKNGRNLVILEAKGKRFFIDPFSVGLEHFFIKIYEARKAGRPPKRKKKSKAQRKKEKEMRS